MIKDLIIVLSLLGFFGLVIVFLAAAILMFLAKRLGVDLRLWKEVDKEEMMEDVTEND